MSSDDEAKAAAESMRKPILSLLGLNSPIRLHQDFETKNRSKVNFDSLISTSVCNHKI